eukprot:4853165-Pleurochrysis_carterae.AAC.2
MSSRSRTLSPAAVEERGKVYGKCAQRKHGRSTDLPLVSLTRRRNRCHQRQRQRGEGHSGHV